MKKQVKMLKGWHIQKSFSTFTYQSIMVIKGKCHNNIVQKFVWITVGRNRNVLLFIGLSIQIYRCQIKRNSPFPYLPNIKQLSHRRWTKIFMVRNRLQVVSQNGWLIVPDKDSCYIFFKTLCCFISLMPILPISSGLWKPRLLFSYNALQSIITKSTYM